MMIFGFFKAHNKCPKEILRYAPPFSHVCDFILVYINNLNQEMNSCKVHQFADDTDLLCLSNSIKQLNKLVNVSYLSYCSPVWAQNCNTIQRMVILQKKAVRIINFQLWNSDICPLFKQTSILKFQDTICSENILFVGRFVNNLSLLVFNTWFSFSSNQHNYETSGSIQGNLIKRFYKTNRYGKYLITASAVESWNKIQK